jgi:ABC-type multidrug transport system fused ATPase/permease subunit
VSDSPSVSLRSLLPYLRDHRATLVLVAVLSLLGSGTTLAQPLLTRQVLDGLQAARAIWGTVVLLVVVLAAVAVLNAVRDYLLQRTAEGLVLGSRRRLTRHLLRLPISEYDRRRTGDLLSRVGADTTLLRAVVTSGLFETVTGAVMVVGATVAMLLLDPVLFLTAGLGLALGLSIALVFSRRVRPASEAAQARTALVGPSGAGKSTLLQLVERFYDVTAGAIRVAGTDVRELPRRALRAQLGYVEQEAPVLAGTLRENLRLTVPAATEAQMLEVLAAVNLTDIVTRTPEGLDAQVGEGGVLLSGGERQRLAIARTLLAAPPILLLDEPTSNLDARNEVALREAIDMVARDRTMIVVAHRLSTVVDADQIVVLEAGRVAAIGRHEELLETSPLYRELATNQLLVA